MTLELSGIEISGTDGVLVEGVNLALEAGMIGALLGASGSGKTLAAKAALGLLPAGLKMTAGEVLIDGHVVDEKGFRPLRGLQVGMVFQQPRLAFNPCIGVGEHLVDALRSVGSLDRSRAKDRALRALAAVGFPEPKSRFGEFAHQFSGGQLQRAAMALALIHEPRFLIADEPTSSLDSESQAHILGLMRQLQQERQLGVLLITHDKRVARAMAQDFWWMAKGGPVAKVAAP